jgi:hypothetical protein
MMREDRLRQEIRLRLLALMLALALTWYAINPAPGPARRVNKNEAPPDQKRHEVKPVVKNIGAWSATAPVMMRPTVHPVAGNIDDLEWPEIIETS